MAIEFISNQCIDGLDTVFFDSVVSDCLYHNARRWEGLKTFTPRLANLPAEYGFTPLDLFRALLRI